MFIYHCVKFLVMSKLFILAYKIGAQDIVPTITELPVSKQTNSPTLIPNNALYVFENPNQVDTGKFIIAGESELPNGKLTRINLSESDPVCEYGYPIDVSQAIYTAIKRAKHELLEGIAELIAGSELQAKFGENLSHLLDASLLTLPQEYAIDVNLSTLHTSNPKILVTSPLSTVAIDYGREIRINITPLEGLLRLPLSFFQEGERPIGGTSFISYTEPAVIMSVKDKGYKRGEAPEARYGL